MTDYVSLIKARIPVIGVETAEELRCIDEIRAAGNARGRETKVWSPLSGVPDLDGSEDIIGCIQMYRDGLKQNNAPSGILIMADPEEFLKSPLVQRAFKELAYEATGSDLAIFLVGPSLTTALPEGLQRFVHCVEDVLPDRTALWEILDAMFESIRVRGGDHDELFASGDDIVTSGLGLTTTEFRNVVALGIVSNQLTPKMVLREKAEIVKKSGVLEFYPPQTSLSDIGGLSNLKRWIEISKGRFSPEAEAFGLKPPKGVMLLGLPGTGKSLSAKAMSAYLNMPLLRVDMGAIASQFYGESTSRLKKALQMAETVSPSILWFDEIEKMFGSSGGQGRHEETGRMLGTILTHMEECDKPILRVATCNDHAALPPELMQRFEKLFFVDLPGEDEAAEIFKIHVEAAGRTMPAIEYGVLGNLAHKGQFSGREIRNIVYECLANAFAAESDLKASCLSDMLVSKTSMAKARRVELDAVRKWAEQNAEPAGTETPKPARKAGEIIEL